MSALFEMETTGYVKTATHLDNNCYNRYHLRYPRVNTTLLMT